MSHMRKKTGFTLVETMIVVLLIAILVSIAVPNFVSARNQSRRRACLENLRSISQAKEQWAMENRMETGSPCTVNDLSPEYMRIFPSCPAAGSYSVNSVGVEPVCSAIGHAP